MSRIEASGVRTVLGDRIVLDDVSMHADAGEVVAVVGPNGAGKTTLLRCLAGETPIDHGRVSIDGIEPRSLGAGSRAAARALLAQSDRQDVPYDVRTVVGFGTHVSTLDREGQEALVERCLHEMELDGLADRVVSTLSGGERRRVSLARTLAQNAPAILLDEPTDSLDFAHADMTMVAARSRADAGAAVVLTTHDIDLAAKHASRLVVLHRGAVVAQGAPDEVLTAALLSDVYGCRIEVGRHPTDGHPVIYR